MFVGAAVTEGIVKLVPEEKYSVVPPSVVKKIPKSPPGNSATGVAEEIWILPAPPAVAKGNAPKLCPVVEPTFKVEPASIIKEPAEVLLVVTFTVWKNERPSPINTGVDADGMVPEAGPP